MATASQPVRPDLLSMFPEELLRYVREELQEPGYRAKQIFTALQRGCLPSEMSTLPLSLRDRLEKQTTTPFPLIEQRYRSRLDGTVKYLWTLQDGENVESVFMRYRHGNTLCVSTQAGCRMGCAFCASTLGGRVRDLEASEILGQVIMAQKDLYQTEGENPNNRISGIVLMGIGEPLDNYENVIRFLRLVNNPDGLNIGYRHISLSTCGLVDGILRLSDEDLPITLSVSLHASSDELRSEIMPVNRKWGISSLLQASRAYFEKTGRRVSFEYALIAGKNDTKVEADRLCAVLRRELGTAMPIHVNLIPVNPIRESRFSATDRVQTERFAAALKEHGINATVRRTLGADINASCGQLRNRIHQEKVVFPNSMGDGRPEHYRKESSE
ncbi:MAG: 23S rRNA (adenine(2503)-C(2))-methyltransferase RlmN [Clostridia bacterium]|nr:23S rRNA (adenine(2503)-C(2))-methyltransferase RlmN [Clostridia bacterium]